jgi:MFS family permease
MAMLVCLAMFFCDFLAAGPSVAIVNITIDFFHTPPSTPEFSASVAKVAYFVTTAALMQGLSNLIGMALIVKYGRRPIYLASFTLYTVCSIWVGVSKSYRSELVARIILGLAAGWGE